jgi:hypothetical protein
MPPQECPPEHGQGRSLWHAVGKRELTVKWKFTEILNVFFLSQYKTLENFLKMRYHWEWVYNAKINLSFNSDCILKTPGKHLKNTSCQSKVNLMQRLSHNLWMRCLGSISLRASQATLMYMLGWDPLFRARPARTILWFYNSIGLVAHGKISPQKNVV